MTDFFPVSINNFFPTVPARNAITTTQIDWTNLSINPGETRQIVLTGEIAGLLGEFIGTWTNTGAITDPTNHPGTLIHTATDTQNFTVRPKRELSIDKVLTGVTYADDDGGSCAGATCPVYGSGDTLTYHITITNTGNAEITGLRVTDALPANFAYVSSDNNGTLAGTTVTWNNLYLSTGTSSLTLTLTGRLVGDSTGSMTNTVTLLTGSVVGRVNGVDVVNPRTDSVTVQRLGRAYLSLTKTVLSNAINQ